MRDYLGLEPPDDARGVLQDIHWSIGAFGYFPTYALGNLISAQLWEKVLSEIPDLPDQFEQGEFGSCTSGCATGSTRSGGSSRRRRRSSAWSAAR